METKRRVRPFDIARGLLKGLPRAHIALTGLLRLALTRPGQRNSIGLVLEKWARRRPDHPAVVDADRSYTYARFNARANQMAALMRREGVTAGEGVALLMENRADLLVLAAGTVKLGGVGVMLNHQQRGDVLAHSLHVTEPSALVVGRECRQAFESVRDRLPGRLAGRIFCLADDDADPPVPGCRDLAAALDAEAITEPPETAAIHTRDPAFHVLTSGTTGMPKAAIMSHGRWLRAMYGVGLGSLGMRGDDIVYCPLPLYHNNALTLSWGAALGGGGTLAVARRFSASRFWDEVNHFRATAFSYIGELCRYLLAQPEKPAERRHSVRVMLGNGLRPELWQPFRERFGIPHINEFYGASECNLLFTNAFDVQPSCGFTPFRYAVVAYDPDTEGPLRDGKGRLQRVRAGEVGLLLSKVTRHAPFDGYTSREESDRKLFRDAFRRDDCWFNTGDLVRRMGWRHVQFVDRLGDTFRWKGENVATTEVEQVLNGFPQVRESVVYGVRVPGREGRAGMAALTLVRDEPLDRAGLGRYLRERLADYAIPLFLRLREDHATTSTFKHHKAELQREGFDPAGVEDELYVFDADTRRYEPMTTQRYRAVVEEGRPADIERGGGRKPIRRVIGTRTMEEAVRYGEY
ncbi:long-chain-acyl-CoA synthetase [Ectothiorhodospiraceae bacterium WFHF3C12]|nr:long-chain-acyl-CoA synthetase [Ectothiorhodospiraceae bacterium WFHF3C12]